MIVGKNQVQQIGDALEKQGAFDENTFGQILTSPVPRACTYLGK
jgi:hypothetical protein